MNSRVFSHVDPVRILLSTCLVCILCPAHAQDTELFDIHDAAKLRGNYSIGNDINNEGHVAGTFTTEAREPRAFVWDGAVMTELPTIEGGRVMNANAINNAGWIAGFVEVSRLDERLFLWDGERTQDLSGPLTGEIGVRSIRVLAMNDLGWILGSQQTGAETLGRRRPFVWDGLRMRTIDFDENRHRSIGAFPGISNSGQVTGASIRNGSVVTDAWVWDPSTGLQLLFANHEESSAGVAISDTGWVTGYWRLSPGGSSRAFVWNGTGQDLGPGRGVAVSDAGWVAIRWDDRAFLWDGTERRELPSVGLMRPKVINDWGWIAGEATVAGEAVAFLWTGDQMRNLGHLGGGGLTVTAMNDQGWITGLAGAGLNETHAFVWRNVGLDVEIAQVVFSPNIDDDEFVDLIQGKPAMLRVSPSNLDLGAFEDPLATLCVTAKYGLRELRPHRVPNLGELLLEPILFFEFENGEPFVPNELGGNLIRVEIGLGDGDDCQVFARSEMIVDVKQTNALRVHYVVLEDPSDAPCYTEFSSSSELMIQRAGEFLRAVWPTAEYVPTVNPTPLLGFKRRPVLEIVPLFDPVWNDLMALAQLRERRGDFVDRVIAIAPDGGDDSTGYFFCNGRSARVCGTGSPTFSTGVVQVGSAPTVAHELAHTFGLRTGSEDGPPENQEEYFDPTADDPGDSEASIPGRGNRASGWWVSRREQGNIDSDPFQRWCFMGRQKTPVSDPTFARVWVDKQDFERLFSRMVTGRSEAKGVARGAGQESSDEVVVVSGLAHRDGVFRSGSWFTSDAPRTPTVPSSGRLRVSMLNASGAALSEREVPGEFLLNLTPVGTEESDVTPVVTTLPLSSTSVAVDISLDGRCMNREFVLTKILRDALASIEDGAFLGDSTAVREGLENQLSDVERVLLSKGSVESLTETMEGLRSAIADFVDPTYEPRLLAGISRSELLTTIDHVTEPSTRFLVEADDLYRLEFRGPEIITGVAGDTIPVEVFCVLAHAGGGAGASSWALSVKALGALIVDLRTDGTSADEVPTGLREGGSEESGVAIEQDYAAYSVVELSEDGGVSLSSNTESVVAVVTVAVEVPPDGARSVLLSFSDGASSPGGEVSNSIVQDGVEYLPLLGQKEITIVLPEVRISRGISTMQFSSSATPIDVVLDVTVSPQSGPHTAEIRDALPTSWTVSGISHGGVFADGEVSWTLDDLTEDTTLSYTVVPHDSTRADASVSGSYSFGGSVPFDIARSQLSWVPTEFVRGECNGDGIVNISDVICTVVRLFAENAPIPCRAALDANGDAAVDVSDAVYVLQFLFREGTPPSDPFHNCGALPVDEPLSCRVSPDACGVR